MKYLKRNLILFLIFTLVNINIFASERHDLPDSLDVEYAKKLINKVNQTGKVSEMIDNKVPTILPVGISKNLAGQKEQVALDSIVFTTEGGYLTAYSVMQNPNNNDTTLAFKVSHADFNNGGFTGDAKLVLLEDAEIKIADSTSLTFKKGGTYINWDCNGFKELSIDCDVKFNRDFIVPENPDGTQDSTGKQVVTQFQAQIQSWNQLLIDISLPPFQIKKLEGFGFYVSHAVFDFSDSRNSAAMVFPPNYMTPSMPEPYSPLWRGFYLQQMQIKLPPEFETKGSTARITLSADNILIDELGFTGKLSGYNLLTIENGTAGGWGFSLDTLSVDIFKNNFRATRLAGRIQLPVMDDGDALQYTGFIDNSGNYLLNVELKSALSVPMWAANLDLYNNSSVSISRKNKQFIASANLNGDITINKSGDSKINIEGLEFQGLKLQTIKPYMDIQSLALTTGSQNKMANFPVALKKIEIQKQANDIGLGLDLAINFVGDEDQGFAADAGFVIWGTLNTDDGNFKYEYKDISFSDIGIDIDAGAFSLKGKLKIFKQDPTFGNGFKGNIEAKFLPGFTVATTAQFGTVNSMRYWYVDGLLAFPAGIPIATTGLGIYGFGGGAYYHMRKNGNATITIPKDESGNKTDTTSLAGASLTGISYLPDVNSFLGVKASVIFGTYPSADAFNSMATFEMTFNSGGGLNFIGFQGDAYFMTPIKDRGKNSKFYATTEIGYDFTNKILHGQTSVYINFPHLVEGANNNHLAGTSILHFAPNDWYITVGTPDQRIGLKIIDILNLTSYFMVGTSIPDMPELPDNVKQIAKDINFNRSQSDLSSGKGFAFGASLDAHIDKTIWVIHGKFDAGIGFDLMMKNYGTGTHCEGASEPIGLKGWYAQGQAYAYLAGSLGLKIKKGIFKGTYNILDLGVAAVLQTKLPNPFWMQGNVAGYYNVLGGVVSGNFNYEFEIGEQCKIIAASGLDGMDIIAGISPIENATDVDVFTSPQLAFNMKIGKKFEFTDINNNKKTYRIAFDYFNVKNNSTTIPGSLEWNSTNDVVAFNPVDILPGETNLNLEAKVHFEQLTGETWKPVYSDGKLVSETKSASFKTGVAPDYIPENNVKYSYPINRQTNFYKNEVNYGYVKLKQGQDYLFEQDEDWVQKVRFKGTADSVDVNLTYDQDSNTINFSIPQNLNNNKIYKLTIRNIPVSKVTAIDENVKNIQKTTSDTNGTVNINTKEIQGSHSIYQDKELYALNFRTSNYNTFIEKIEGMTISPPWSWSVLNGIHDIGVNIIGNEYFDKFELNGANDYDPLVQIFTDNNNTWFNDYTNPLFYNPLSVNATNKFPSDVNISWRDGNILGIPPVKTSYISLSPAEDIYLSDANIQNNSFSSSVSFANLTNSMDFYQYKDYENLVQQAGAHPQRYSNFALNKLMTTPYPSMLAGYPNYLYYKIKLEYFLPGKSTPSSIKIIQIGY